MCISEVSNPNSKVKEGGKGALDADVGGIKKKAWRGKKVQTAFIRWKGFEERGYASPQAGLKNKNEKNRATLQRFARQNQ